MFILICTCVFGFRVVFCSFFFYINTYSLTFIDIEIVKNNHGFLCFQKVFVNLLVSIWDF